MKPNAAIASGLKKLTNATNKLDIQPFDAADYLTSPEMIKGFLNEVIASGEPAAIQHALGVAARARGMSQVAKAAGLSRENLYRSLSGTHEANFSTIVNVASALGFVMTFKSKKTRAPRKARAKGGIVIVGRTRKVAKSRRGP